MGGAAAAAIAKIVKGAMAIIHWPDGAVLAADVDFDRSGYGGMSLFNAQSYRVRAAVKREAIRKLCHADVVACLEQHHLESLFRAMVREKVDCTMAVPESGAKQP